MEPKVINVQPQKEKTLILEFSNGEVRRFDMSPYLEHGVFRQLKDWNCFKQAKVLWGTVTWPDELDMSPETLYLESYPVKS